nr:hypothetical protein BaRGS_009293 [Batillaria attramentaria]
MFVCFSATHVKAQDFNVTVPGVGEIQGREELVTYRDTTQSAVATFRGIPYAEPPVGQLRFAKPVPKAGFTAPFQAFEFGPMCPQPLQGLHVESEDCLHLSVFVPAAHLRATDTTTDPLPVYVWIHGGAFVTGSGDKDVRYLVTFGNIIVVTMNYRLGALGFLTTLDQEAPGNYGLWDQRLALQWVKANIRAFGGDPDKITIGGSSAGGFSVSFQALHAGNEGLFHRFIAESGNAISVTKHRDYAANYTSILGVRLGCDTTTSRAIVSCLRQKNYTDIIGDLGALLPQEPFDLPFGPAEDNDFFTENPTDLIKWPPSKAGLESIKSRDVMLGTTSAEGSVSYNMWVTYLAMSFGENSRAGVSKQLFDAIAKGLLTSQKEHPDQEVVDAMEYEYTDWDDPENSTTLAQSTVDLLTDKHWFVPNVIFSRNHALNNNETGTYLFEFDLNVGNSKLPWLHGAPHVAYDRYVWGAHGNDKEWELSKVFMTYWSNFIKTGNPNSPLPVKEQWLPFDVENEHYLYVDDDVISTRKHCKAKRTDFWLDYVPRVKAAAQRGSRPCAT